MILSFELHENQKARIIFEPFGDYLIVFRSIPNLHSSVILVFNLLMTSWADSVSFSVYQSQLQINRFYGRFRFKPSLNNTWASKVGLHS